MSAGGVGIVVSTGIQSLTGMLAAFALVLAPLGDCCNRPPCEHGHGAEVAATVSHAGHDQAESAHAGHREMAQAPTAAHQHHTTTDAEIASDVAYGHAQEHARDSAAADCAEFSCDIVALKTKTEKHAQDASWFALRIVTVEDGLAGVAAIRAADRTSFGLLFTPPPKTKVFLLTQRIRI